MNKHIELVKKWLDSPESVSQKELDINAAIAGNNYANAINVPATTTATVAYAYAAADAAYASAYAANANSDADNAAKWVKHHGELNK